MTTSQEGGRVLSDSSHVLVLFCPIVSCLERIGMQYIPYSNLCRGGEGGVNLCWLSWMDPSSGVGRDGADCPCCSRVVTNKSDFSDPIHKSRCCNTRYFRASLPITSAGGGFWGVALPFFFHVPSRERLARLFGVGEEVWVGRTKWQEGWKNFLVVRTNAINIANMDLE